MEKRWSHLAQVNVIKYIPNGSVIWRRTDIGCTNVRILPQSRHAAHRAMHRQTLRGAQ